MELGRLVDIPENADLGWYCCRLGAGCRGHGRHRPNSAGTADLACNLVCQLLRCDGIRRDETDPELVDWHRAFLAEYLFHRALHGYFQFT